MKVEYKIDEGDLLTFYLYYTSKSKQQTKQRQQLKNYLPIGMVFFALILLPVKEFETAIAFFVIAVLWFLLYPIYYRRSYIKHHKSFIEENEKELIGESGTIEIENDYITSKSCDGESKINTTAIEQIIELPTIIFVKLKNGQSIIFPKAKISDISLLTVRLKELAHHLQITYLIDNDWKWK